MRPFGLNWGTLPDEQELAFPCDGLIEENAEPAFRAVSVLAPVAVVFRRLCQLRVAPYSYDWLDNFGRRSPEALTPGLEQLEVGQEVMRIFRLASFERDRHFTLVLESPGSRRLFGDLAISYLIRVEASPEADKASCRLLAKLVFHFHRGVWASLARISLPPGDLIMMRRQLLNLKRLAEADASSLA